LVNFTAKRIYGKVFMYDIIYIYWYRFTRLIENYERSIMAGETGTVWAIDR
jgi:hypothetical protein